MSEIRNKYVNEELDEKTVDRDPIRQFQKWLREAEGENLILPEAATLATATRSARPTGRLVLLKHVDAQGFVFYTNYQSDKARALDENPFAALIFYWAQLERQVRVEGSVTRVSEKESDEYFRTRPRDSQIGALASPQSEVIESRDVLEERFRKLEEMYRDGPIERPGHWGGYRIRPERIEFWKGRVGRLHDRIVFERESNELWSIKRLAP
jgi:pyridoxamine 5'-phosphate oxidase